MAGEDLIDFEVIEGHKENIQALPSGRSAKALAALYSPPLTSGRQSTETTCNDAHSAARAEFEQELSLIDEADDPLDIYDRYVKWTLDTYPSAQSTPQSRLLPLLELATKAFLSSPQYQNDPRYLKLWLHYIRFFSDAPRETFVFLARQGIAESLALYYEEFAAWLESAGRWTQADEVYKMGIERGATPASRLLRKFGEFEQRNAARPQDVAEPTSPALPIARPALAAKIDPFSAASTSEEQQSARSTAPAKKSKSGKMAIFSDDSPQQQSAFGSTDSPKGWDSIGSLQSRKKENTIAPKPMAGETLKTGKTNTGVQKMMVFKSTSSARHAYESSNHESQRVINPRTGRPECVFVNLEAVYPNPNDPSIEYCFEELRARHRGWLQRDWATERREQRLQRRTQDQENAPPRGQDDRRGFDIFQDTSSAEAPKSAKGGHEDNSREQRKFQIFQDIPEEKPAPLTIDSSFKVLSLNDENDENKPPSKQEVEIAKRMRREERANRTRKIQVMDVETVQKETQTIKLNMDSPTGPKIRKKKVAEPTMTINTREAMDEIYGIFSQPVNTSQEEPADESESDDDSDDDDDYTSGGESTATGHISAAGSDYGDETRREILASQTSKEDTTAETEDQDDEDNHTAVSAWSDYSNKPVSESNTSTDQPQASKLEVVDDELSTPREEFPPPHSDEDEEPRTRYIPMPPADYEPVTSQYRDPVLVAQNRLPFMTPIVEQTESSINAATIRAGDKGYFAAKTPSRQTHSNVEELDENDEDGPWSSPFQDMLNGVSEDKRKVLQPIRTKTTKGIVSLSDDVGKPRPLALRLAADSEKQKGPIIKDPQINPVDPEVRQTILAQIHPPLTSYEGYHEHLTTTSARTPEIRKFARAIGKGKNAVDKSATGLAAPTLKFQGSESTYTVKRELGAGAFAPVYLIENSHPTPSHSSNDENDENTPPAGTNQITRSALEALKMEDPISTWEFYMLRQTHLRLSNTRAASSIIHAHEMHIFRDEGFLIEEFRGQGTLLDLINVARAEANGTLDEQLAMFFAVELLRTVETLHSKNIIHGDLKGDNVLVRFETGAGDLSASYSRHGTGNWKEKGITLIDFGRSIDMDVFAPEVQFVADWETSSADCPEMRELRPWTYQVDYFGLAGLLHSLLFGKYMSVVSEKNGGGLGQGTAKRYRIKESLKRYWQTQIWSEAFDVLLNPGGHVEGERNGRMPLLGGLGRVRGAMEDWLEGNCERGLGLRTLVRKMEEAVRARKK